MKALRKQLAIFLAGVILIIPLALTIYVLVAGGIWLNDLGTNFLKDRCGVTVLPGVGALAVLVAVYLVGLMTRLYLFRPIFSLIDRWMSSLPGVKIIYESTRDLLQLFGPESRRMGRAVIYRHPGTDMVLLGIMTNEVPVGIPQAPSHRVAVYVPLGAQLGGLMIYVPPEHLEDANVPVEEVLKVSAVAQVGSKIVVGPNTPSLLKPPREEGPQAPA